MKILKKILSISISCFFIYLCLKDIPLRNLFNSINFNLNFLIFAIISLFLINFLKAARLRLLMKNYKKRQFNFYFRPILLRQFLNTTFFLNAGELLTPITLKRYFRCSYFEGLSILFFERLIDLTVIAFIIGVSLLFNDFNLNYKIILIYFIVYLSLVFSLIFIVNFKKQIFFIPKNIIDNIVSGYNYSIKNKDILWMSLFFSLVVWAIFILIDLLIFKAFEITSPISSLSNIIFLTGVMVLSQFIPAAPASVGVFNYFIIETIEAFYNAKNLNFDLSIQTELTSISIIILLIYILPDITWGAYVFYKESLQNLKKL
tara:strand:- start:3227 stop:4177 length:951 start_codon:yes stop_codon:yes gene_type:complete